MDDIVLRSMLKWPDVPSVYGWLRLDRRGRWLIRMPERGDAGTAGPRFERIVNPAMIEFIGRNYAHDGEGRYFFQNGPQRVYVALEYTPWIFSLDGAGQGLVTHTGAPAGAPRAACFDERGGLVLVCERGVGEVLDRDLAALEQRFLERDGQPLDVEALIGELHAGRTDMLSARILGADVTVEAIRSVKLAAHCGFVAQPRPPEGQPDC